jgi:PAS domain S-box-containing protein
MNNTHEWCAEGIEPQIQNLEELPSDSLPWFMELVRRLEVFHVPRVADMPSKAKAEKEHFQAQGIQSLIVVPMIYGGSLVGFVGFDSVREEKRWAEDSTALLKIVGEIFVNALERKQAGEVLRENEEKYRTLFEDSRDPVAISTREGKLVDVNQAWLDLYGVTREEITDFNVHQLWANLDDRSRWVQELEQKGFVRDFEARHLKKDGTEMECLITSTLWRAHDESVVAYQGIVRDVTEKRKLQAQILQSEKMAAIGQLAAGVAHEINNPTGFVSSNLNTLSDYQNDMFSLIKEYKKLITDLKEAMATAKYPGSIPEQMKQIVALESKIDINYILDDMPNLIEESLEGTERIKRIVIDLKDFAHPGEQKLKYANINKNFDSTLNIVWNELKYKTTVTKDYGELPKVQCYPQQIKQVFMNLLLNAAQAVEKKGEIRIVTRAVDGQVEIVISDTGSGITKENLSKIFDPFFTTKDVGKGTGLGLNIAYNIIQRHKGTIEAHSEVGKGTTFTIRIPVS